jgi:flagellar assembly protein FliH
MSSSKIYKGAESAAAYELKELLSSKAMREMKLVEQARSREREGRERLEMIEREAYAKGFEGGEKAGAKAATDKASALIKSIAGTLDEITRYKETYYSEHGAEVAAIVGKAARKIVGAELKLNPDVVVNVVDAAIKSVITREEIIIRLSADDYAHLKEHRPDFFETLNLFRKCRIEAGPSIGRGGCVIESSHGEVDARIEAALDALDASLRGAVKLGPETDKKDR